MHLRNSFPHLRFPILFNLAEHELLQYVLFRFSKTRLYADVSYGVKESILDDNCHVFC